eukprot:354135-Chlamydomonas_euryale.AAC.8
MSAHNPLHAATNEKYVAFSPPPVHGPPAPQVLDGVSKKHGVSVSNVALRWVMQQGDGQTVCPIVGVRGASHIADNARVFDFALDAEDLEAIDKVLAEAQGPNGDCYSFERGGIGGCHPLPGFKLDKQALIRHGVVSGHVKISHASHVRINPFICPHHVQHCMCRRHVPNVMLVIAWDLSMSVNAKAMLTGVTIAGLRDYNFVCGACCEAAGGIPSAFSVSLFV